jgi:hypothetical protein
VFSYDINNHTSSCLLLLIFVFAKLDDIKVSLVSIDIRRVDVIHSYTQALYLIPPISIYELCESSIDRGDNRPLDDVDEAHTLFTALGLVSLPVCVVR